VSQREAWEIQKQRKEGNAYKEDRKVTQARLNAFPTHTYTYRRSQQ
jgi:hypothetical protein